MHADYYDETEVQPLARRQILVFEHFTFDLVAEKTLVIRDLGRNFVVLRFGF
jgi:hypothetical protein